MSKRVVIEHMTGLVQILGTLDQLQAHLSTDALPLVLDNVNLVTHTGSVRLVKIAPRYVLYREIMNPPTNPIEPEAL